MSKAVATRGMILQKAFELIYIKGFQATSIDEIIARTQVTKGAFFYHFKNKEQMGLAMIREVLYPGMYTYFVTPLVKSQKPKDELYEMMKNVLLKAPVFQVKYGCPAVNLIEELSSVNTRFHAALLTLVGQWQTAIAQSISAGKARGIIRQNVDPEQVADFIIAGYAGIRNLGKLLGASCYQTYLKEYKIYLKGLS